MPDYWQTVYDVFIVACTVVSVTLMWRKDRRDTKAGRDRLVRQARQLRNSIGSQIIGLLYTHLISIRRMYIHLSEEDRLEKELQMTFDKPEVLDAIAEYHFDAFEFNIRCRRLSQLRLAQRLCSVVGGLCLLGFIVPWLLALRNDDVTLSHGSWALFAAAIVATIGFIVLSIYVFSTERRLTALVQHVPETG